jgi:hypothetical protein
LAFYLMTLPGSVSAAHALWFWELVRFGEDVAANVQVQVLSGFI